MIRKKRVEGSTILSKEIEPKGDLFVYIVMRKKDLKVKELIFYWFLDRNENVGDLDVERLILMWKMWKIVVNFTLDSPFFMKDTKNGLVVLAQALLILMNF